MKRETYWLSPTILNVWHWQNRKKNIVSSRLFAQRWNMITVQPEKLSFRLKFQLYDELWTDLTLYILKEELEDNLFTSFRHITQTETQTEMRLILHTDYFGKLTDLTLYILKDRTWRQFIYLFHANTIYITCIYFLLARLLQREPY